MYAHVRVKKYNNPHNPYTINVWRPEVVVGDHVLGSIYNVLLPSIGCMEREPAMNIAKKWAEVLDMEIVEET